MDYYSFIGFLLYGLVAGVLARTLFPGEDKGGLLITSLLGILGSVTGGWVFNLFGWGYTKGFSFEGLVPAVCGAVGLLFLYNTLGGILKNRLSK